MNIPIYHITHIKNLEGILKREAIFSDSAINRQNIVVKSFSKADLKYERTQFRVPVSEGGVLADYVPFFFSNRPPMLYSIKFRHGNDIQKQYLHLVSSVNTIAHNNLPFCFTDGHGIMEITSFSEDLHCIDHFLDWKTIHNTYWADTSDDGDRKRRKQAEFLVYNMVPWACIKSISLIDNTIKRTVEEIFSSFSKQYHIPIEVDPDWYYL